MRVLREDTARAAQLATRAWETSRCQRCGHSARCHLQRPDTRSNGTSTRRAACTSAHAKARERRLSTSHIGTLRRATWRVRMTRLLGTRGCRVPRASKDKSANRDMVLAAREVMIR